MKVCFPDAPFDTSLAPALYTLMLAAGSRRGREIQDVEPSKSKSACKFIPIKSDTRHFVVTTTCTEFDRLVLGSNAVWTCG
jgi:hypothetical protein